MSTMQNTFGLSGPHFQDDHEKEQWLCQKGSWPCTAYLLHQLCLMCVQGQGHKVLTRNIVQAAAMKGISEVSVFPDCIRNRKTV